MNAHVAADVWAAARRDLALVNTFLEEPHLVLRQNAVLAITGGPTADFNLAMLDVASDDAAVLRDFAARVRARNVQAEFMLSSACGARLAAVAREEGLSHAGSAPLMLLADQPEHARTHQADHVRTTDALTIEQVADSRRLSRVVDLVASAFELDHAWVGKTFVAATLLNAPGVRYFLASADQEPCSTVMTTAGLGPVGIWCMATAPERRRQGAARAVLQAAIKHHRAEGKAAFYLIATPAGKPLYDGLGFNTVDELAIWITGRSEQLTAG